ncbi:centromere protein O [Aulostomus maculatus]
MEGAAAKGVMGHLSFLEVQARSRKTRPRQRSRVTELRAEVEALVLQRDRLRAEVQIHKDLKERRRRLHGGGESLEAGSSPLEQLMARHTQLTDLLRAHHLIGGYDVIRTRQGKGVCVSIVTAYEGTYLDTYSLEIDLKPTVRVSRHSVPAFVPLDRLVEQSDMQTDIRAFLDVLSRHLNAFEGRKQQLKLVKEQHTSVEVMESNVLCSILVLMFTVPKQENAILCTLDYTDHSRCLPTGVRFECEDTELPDSPQWERNRRLLLETPAHKALTAMKKMGTVA